jgi:hypothetical protein
MMDMAETIRAAVQREIRPLLADCARIREELDRTEAAFPIVLDQRERNAIRIDLVESRARLEAVLSKLHGVEDHIVQRARERWPQCR